ncbi:hypothetical protein [Spirillospora sp. NPDC029432]|uniref:hypothetical protein n=1 Tax=Spirillospora sp. NPDC029432 TaxID=3154599 RepID=UPI0034515664
MTGDQGAGEERAGGAAGPPPPEGARPAGGGWTAPGAGAEAYEGRAGARPGFLPPAEERPYGHPAWGPPPPPEPAGQGNVWNIAVVLSSVLLLVSAFLPWAEARIAVDIFGRTLSRDLGTVIGIEADGMVAAVPVLALVAAGMALWGVVGRDDRISALGAVPGALSLLVCVLFVLRLGDLKERIADESLTVGYEVAVVTGWYLAVAMSLLIIGFALARPLAARMGAPRRDRETPPPHPDQPYTGAPQPDQPYGGRPPSEQPYAGQPQAEQPYGRAPQAEQPQSGQEDRPDAGPAHGDEPQGERPRGAEG